MRTYAVGDIHGCAELLLRALEWISNDARDNKARVVFIGDYIDRGPCSREVLDILMKKRVSRKIEFICLMGNHEQLCIDAFNSERNMDDWLHSGGRETLQSFRGQIDQRYLDWMARLPLFFQDDQRIFVHAGLEPGVPLERQTRESLLWIREPFFRTRRSFGKHVVHGHTPIGPQQLKRRTNIDAGAVFTGNLCVAVFSEIGRPTATNVVLIK